MSELYQQTEYRGYHINIYYDDAPDSPRVWDNLGTFYTSHPRYRTEEDFHECFEREEVFDEQCNFLDSFEKQYIALNIYLYDHGGLTVSSSPFSCPWDSGLFGIVAVSIEKVKKEYGWKLLTKSRRRKIEKYLQGEIDTYDQYLRGEVYRYQITPIGDCDDVLDSCWGYYGPDGLEEILSQCKHAIDYEIEEKQRQAHEERIRQYDPEYAFS